MNRFLMRGQVVKTFSRAIKDFTTSLKDTIKKMNYYIYLYTLLLLDQRIIKNIQMFQILIFCELKSIKL